MPVVSFSDFRDIIQHHTVNELTTTDLLKISEYHQLSSYYTPFDYLSADAKIVIVGICPGRTQWQNSIIACKEALSEQQDIQTILKHTKQSGAFSGPIRNNLVKILDHIGLNQNLKINSTASLFQENQHLVHMNSVLKQAIFVNGKNYAGTHPNILKHQFLLQHIHDYFIPEVKQLPNALYLPMGKCVLDVLHYVSSLGYLKPEQILKGLPHPSGANAERIQYFLGLKSADTLSNKTNPVQIDTAKAALLTQLSHIQL